jgi:hypothetical protein
MSGIDIRIDLGGGVVLTIACGSPSQFAQCDN